MELDVAANERRAALERQISSSRKRRAAAAGFAGVGIDEVEALPNDRLLVIQGHAAEVKEGLRVDKDPHILKVEHSVALPGLRVELDVVGETRAAPALHAKAQPALCGRNTLLSHGRADALDRALGHLDSLLRIEDVKFGH